MNKTKRLVDDKPFMSSMEGLWVWTTIWFLGAVVAYWNEWQAVRQFWGPLW